MITFLEYSYNLEQIVKMLKSLVQDKAAKPNDIYRWFIGSVPPDFITKLPEGSRAEAALLLRTALIDDFDRWNTLRHFVEPLWDQPLGSKTLGKELLNYLSAEVMDSTGSDFFISYSGDLPKSSIHKYTKKLVRAFPNNKNYGWKSLSKIRDDVTDDYTSHFNNYNIRQVKKA